MNNPNSSPGCRDYARYLLREESTSIQGTNADELTFARTAKDVGDENAGLLLSQSIERSRISEIELGVITRLAARIKSDQEKSKSNINPTDEQIPLF